MADTPTLPSVAATLASIRQAGWQEESRGAVGSFWSYDEIRVAIPHDWSEDPGIAKSTLRRISEIEGIAYSQLVDEILYSWHDVVKFVATGESIGGGFTPLIAAERILASARGMLRSVATTAVQPTRYIKRQYNGSGEELVRSALLGHTSSNGSYVFPFFVHLASPDSSSGNLDLLENTEELQIEPFQRRVTRTMATALSAVGRAAREEPDLGAPVLERLVDSGVSKELCSAIVSGLSDRRVDLLKVEFEWARAVKTAVDPPQEVVISSDLKPIVRRMATLFKTATIGSLDSYSGQILEIGQTADQSGYHFVINTYRHARPCKLRVEVDKPRHDQAVRWYERGEAVAVRGTVRDTGAGLVMSDPVRLSPLLGDLLPDA